MPQEAGDQCGYQRALQEFQKFDDLRNRTITLMATIDAMAGGSNGGTWTRNP